MLKKRYFITVTYFVFLLLFSLISFSAPPSLPANDGSLSCSKFTPDNYDSCYKYPDCWMNGGCSGQEPIYDYSRIYDYECEFDWRSFSMKYYERGAVECKWAYCDGNTLKYNRNCGVDGACSYNANYDCNNYDGNTNYPPCWIATGGGPLESSSCGPGVGPTADGNIYDYGCVQSGSSARCEKVGVVKPITCTNNPVGCDFALSCAVDVKVDCTEECESGVMSGGRCIERRAPEQPLPPTGCTDGTKIIKFNECSSTKPLYCKEGRLISNPSECGCPVGETLIGGSCVKVEKSCNNNNKIDPGEQCDGADLGGKTCASGNFAGGTLSCSNCILDWTGCVARPAPGVDGVI